MEFHDRLYEVCKLPHDDIWPTMLSRFPECSNIMFSKAVISGITALMNDLFIYREICCRLIDYGVITSEVFIECCKLMSIDERISYIEYVDIRIFDISPVLMMRSLYPNIPTEIITKNAKFHKEILRLGIKNSDIPLLEKHVNMYDGIHIFTKILGKFTKNKALEVLHKCDFLDDPFRLFDYCCSGTREYIIQFVYDKGEISMDNYFITLYSMRDLSIKDINRFNKICLSVDEIREISKKIDGESIENWLKNIPIDV